MQYDMTRDQVKRLPDRCPARPNCVSSRSWNKQHRVEPFHVLGDPRGAWDTLTEVISAMPRMVIVAQDFTYLHAEARSRVLGYVDDIFFQLDPVLGRIDVYAASRKGYWDLGVNRCRVRTIHRKMIEQGMVQNCIS